MFGLGPTYLFFLQNRLPIGLMRNGRKSWVSAMGTNLAIVAVIGAPSSISAASRPVPAVFLPTTLIAASIGVWLFYVQHQFETTHWEQETTGSCTRPPCTAARITTCRRSCAGSPPISAFTTSTTSPAASPSTGCPRCCSDHPELVDCNRMTLFESFKCATLHLWDEKSGKLVSFAAARRLTPAA